MTVAAAHPEPELRGFRRTLARDWKLVLVIALVAAAVRVSALVQFEATPFAHYLTMDARGYQAWSLDIARGHWQGDRVFYQEPLYPYILGLIHLAFGPGLLGVFIAQVVAGAAVCVLAQILAARVTGSRWAGLIAGLLLAFYHTSVFYELQVLKVVWEMLLVLVVAHLLVSAWERPRRRLWVLAGVATALLGLIRGNALVSVPFVLVWMLIVLGGAGWKRAAAAAGLFLAGLAAPMLLVMARNVAVGGDFVLSSSHAGFNFYIGNNAEADGGYAPVTGVREDPRFEADDARAAASAKAGRLLKPSEVSSWWFSQSFDFIGREPGTWVSLEARKLMRFFSADEVPDTWSPEFFAERAPILGVPFVPYALLMPLGVAGLIAMARGGPRAWLVHFLVLATVVSVVIFYVFGRYRMPVVPLFAVSASAALVEFVRRARAGEYALPAMILIAAGATAVLALMPVSSKTSPAERGAVEHYNLGLLYYEEAKEPAKAKDEWNRALVLNPQYSDAMTALARAYIAEDNTTSASGLLHDAIRANNNADAHFLLAGIYHRDKKPRNAIEELCSALVVRPGFFEAWKALTDIFVEQRDRESLSEGVRAAEQAIEYFPASEVLRRNLGILCYRAGDVERARAAWKRALELSPADDERKRVETLLEQLPPESAPPPK